MEKLRLIGKISEPSLLFDLIHELGITFYKCLGNKEYEVVYFSGHKILYFKGKLSEEEIKKLKNFGYEVKKIELFEEEGIVKIEQ